MKIEDVALAEQAKNILHQNWLGTATKPAPRLYPHQWSWDSAFIAMGYAHYDQAKAMQELRSLFRGQWSNGFLPHIVFRQREVKDYFPGPDYWQTERSPEGPKPHQAATSGIIQPPVHATAARHIYRHASDKKAAKHFLAELFPRLKAWHWYLYRDRDIDNNGLIYIRHPWESGQDNSPMWDAVLQRIKVNRETLPPYRRVDLNEIDSSHRPSDRDYDRYVYLMVQARENQYAETHIQKNFPFLIQDVLFNALLVKANRDLAAIAELIDQDAQPFHAWADKTARGMNSRLWNGKKCIYQSYDRAAQQPIDISVAAGFSPLYAQIPTHAQAVQMLKTFYNSNFCGSGSWTVPSCSRQEAVFDPARYWRGPIWINLNWLLIQGFENYGFYHEAEQLRQNSLELPRRSGFYEYFNPDTGAGLGSADFSWTASLVLDLLLKDQPAAEAA